MSAASPPTPPRKVQAFTVKATGTLDRVVTSIRVMPAFDPAAPPIPLPVVTETPALWDTGATKSVISSKVAKSLGLVPVGTTKVNHAGGVGDSLTYLVNFALPNRVGVVGVLATEFDQSGKPFGVIVGMDVICLGDFSITNVDRKTWVSFRTPSIEAIDYVSEANRLAYAGVGRNDPCPCRSGKKFKKCHGA